MKFPLQESSAAKYLYVSQENIVQVFMPVVSGTRIGLDNTCNAANSLQEFFGKGSDSNKKATLKGELLAYSQALKNDLNLLGKDSVLAEQKQERSSQIERLLKVVSHLEKHAELECLNSGIPCYPRPLKLLMQSRETSNLYSMVLRPTVADDYLRSEGAMPVFSVAHQSVARGIQDIESPLQQALIQTYSPLIYKAKDLKSQVIQRTMVQLKAPTSPVQFSLLIQILQGTVKDLRKESVDFTMTQQGTSLQQKDVNEAMGFNSQTTTPEEYIEALLGYCAPNLFGNIPESPFHYLTQAESWSIATQFLLGITNIYSVSKGKVSPDTNFGRILDSRPDLSNSLAGTLAEAQKADDDIEEIALSWINAHANELQLRSSFNQDDANAIKKAFASDYSEVKASRHFDEFFILDTHNNKGDFFIHQGSICIDFAKFASHALFKLPQKLTQALEKACHDMSTLGIEIPHRSPLVQEAIVEIATVSMDSTALQALYERINTYKDPKVKEELFAQLKQERPDFKPKIDAKQFLQCVAYGQRKGAEDLLKKDFAMAQELLTAREIPFTDYSGRTFECTAYEYAFWAKDSGMCLMLERYMNHDTKQELLKLCQKIEELVGYLFKRSTGLAYTQHEKEERSAHFDLDPLKKALSTYLDKYRKNPKKTEADFNALNTVWIKIGLLQREVPAHIAHEYCHPKRSFYDIFTNPALLDVSNDENLEGTLKFYNCVTDSYDDWFTPDSHLDNSGLGSSFAIFRGHARVGAFGSSDTFSHVDLSAIHAIDNARTEQLKQSLANLAAPPVLRAQQLPGGESSIPRSFRAKFFQDTTRNGLDNFIPPAQRTVPK